jgi:integrase
LVSHQQARCGDTGPACRGVLPGPVLQRLPKVHRDESRTQGLDRLELIRFLQVAQTISVHHGALAYLLGINALRATEAAAVRIEDYAETLRGHRVLHLVGKGSKPATMPLTVPVLRVLEACRGERTEGPGHTHALYAYQLRRWFGLVIRPNSGKAIDRRDAYRMVAPERKKRRSGHGMHLAMESKPRHSSPHTW